MADKSKQELVIEMVKEGKYTREEIKDSVNCTTGSLASYLSTMSNIAKFTDAVMCPVTGEGGILSVTSYAEAQEAAELRKASRPSAVSKKTPEERFEAAEKRMTRCKNAYLTAGKRAEDNTDNEEINLRYQLTEINLRLAEIELDKATKAYVPSESDEPVMETEDESVTETDDELL